MHERERRARAAQACVDLYLNKPLSWGKRDCITLARTSLHKMGVKVPAELKGIRWTSLKTAVRRLDELGFNDLDEVMDAVGLAEIAPALAWPGDIVALPGADRHPFCCALTLAVGNGKLLGFGEGADHCGILKPHHFHKAWRVA